MVLIIGSHGQCNMSGAQFGSSKLRLVHNGGLYQNGSFHILAAVDIIDFPCNSDFPAERRSIRRLLRSRRCDLLRLRRYQRSNDQR